MKGNEISVKQLNADAAESYRICESNLTISVFYYLCAAGNTTYG
jgi:hypothetical protein